VSPGSSGVWLSRRWKPGQVRLAGRNWGWSEPVFKKLVDTKKSAPFDKIR
jgi:hypothetical protein